MDASADILNRAVEMIRRGERSEASRLLAGVVARQPENETAWLWFSVCQDQLERRKYCLNRALAINPDNPEARLALERLEKPSAPKPDVDELLKLAETPAPLIVQLPTEAPIITLSCPACGAPLGVTEQKERYRCVHCGVEHLVRESGGRLYLQPLMEKLTRMQQGVSQAAAELSLHRLQDEIDTLEKQAVKQRGKLTQGGKYLLTAGFIFFIYYGMVRFWPFAVLGGISLLIGAYYLSIWWLEQSRLKVQLNQKRAEASNLTTGSWKIGDEPHLD